MYLEGKVIKIANLLVCMTVLVYYNYSIKNPIVVQSSSYSNRNGK